MGKERRGPGRIQWTSRNRDRPERPGLGRRRGNNRIQVFSQDGEFIAQWIQFSRPSAIFIDEQDQIYVPDNTSSNANGRYPEWKRGIRIGSAKDGEVLQFIPDHDQDPTHQGAGAEGLVVDEKGNIYASKTNRKMVREWVRR
jgi:hypothetical protein